MRLIKKNYAQLWVHECAPKADFSEIVEIDEKSGLETGWRRAAGEGGAVMKR